MKGYPILKKDLTVLIFGLDNASETILFNYLTHEKNNNLKQTKGVNGKTI